MWIPRIGLVLFVVGYLVAAARYPGGTLLDRGTVGYAHLGNFWCDLLSVVAYNGQPNAARVIALTATALLPAALLPLWWQLPVLWGASWRRAPVVPVAGTLATVAMLGVATRLHDEAIHVGAVAAGVACGVLLMRLATARLRAVLLGGGFALTCGACDYAAYVGGAPTLWLPGLQKLAGAALLAWFWSLTVTVHRQLRAGPHAPLAPVVH